MADQYHKKSYTSQDGIFKEVIFIKSNVEECTESAEAFDVDVLPSFILIEQHRKPSTTEHGHFYFDGLIRSRYIGDQLHSISEEIDDWLLNDSNISTETEDIGSSFNGSEFYETQNRIEVERLNSEEE